MHPDFVLLLAFGGPDRPEEIVPYLRSVLEGRPAAPGRLESVAEHYRAIGGRSPLLELTRVQGRHVERALEAAGHTIPVRVGMVHWKPPIAEALAEASRTGRRRVAGVVLAPHRCDASWEKYHRAVDQAVGDVGDPNLQVAYVLPWHEDPLFVEAAADRVGPLLNRFPRDERNGVTLVFCAHSVPVTMADRAGYSDQVAASARLVAERLGHSRWTVAWQSRSGRPEDPWLEPDISDSLAVLAGQGVRHTIVVPIGFVCDHVEVLYDLDHEAADAARRHRLNFLRAPTVGDHPAFIRLLAERILSLSVAPKGPARE